MSTKPIVSPKFSEVHIQGLLETYAFATGTSLSEQGKPERVLSHVYVYDGNARSDLTNDEFESAINLINTFKKELPQLLKECATVLKKNGEYRSYDNSIFLKYGPYNFEVTDHNVDGTADMFLMRQSQGIFKNSTKIEAENTPFCGKRTLTEPDNCGEEERSVFEGHILANSSSNTSKSWFCVEKELRPALDGCNENEVAVYEVDRMRQGVIQYLRLFDELFEK